MSIEQLAVIKKADDHIEGQKVLRISIGGAPGCNEAYITYRGNLREIQQLLREVADSFGELNTEPPISPDGGKKFA